MAARSTLALQVGQNDHQQVWSYSSKVHGFQSCMRMTATCTRRAPTVEAAGCGWRHSALVLTDGQLYTCGDNEYGALGLDNDAVSHSARAPPRTVLGGDKTAHPTPPMSQ